MENNKMKKDLGVMAAMSLVVGCVIGAGVFFKPTAIYTDTGGAPGMGMLAWIIGGLASLLGALTFAEVAILIPKTGGMVAYLSDVFHEKVGFLAGWMQVVIFYPAFLAGYGVKIGSVLADAGIVSDKLVLPIAIGIIMLMVFANSLGSKTASRVQIVSTVCKLIPLFLIMIFGFLLGSGDNAIFTPMVGEGKNGGAVLGSTLLAVLFAFEGWTNVGAIAGEMKNPGRDLPRAIVGGVSVIMAVYFFINMAYLWVLPAEQLMVEESPAAAVAKVIFGDIGGALIEVGIIISVLGAANGFLMSGSRVAYHLADMKTLPCSGFLSKLNGNQVPANSVLLIGTLACLYSLIGQFDLLTNLAVFSCWIFYTLTFVCVIKLRCTHPNLERKYKVPLYPVVPLMAIASGLYVIISQMFLSGTGEPFVRIMTTELGATQLILSFSQSQLLSLGSIAITLLGLPVYLAVKKWGKK